MPMFRGAKVLRQGNSNLLKNFHGSSVTPVELKDMLTRVRMHK